MFCLPARCVRPVIMCLLAFSDEPSLHRQAMGTGNAAALLVRQDAGHDRASPQKAT